MAYKKSGGMDLGTLLIYGVAGYFVYTNWSSISAWFSNLTAPAAAVAPAASPTIAPSAMSASPLSPAQVVAPSSAGTLVPLAPVQSTPQPIATMPPTTEQPGAGLTLTTPTDQPAPPAGSEFMIMRPEPPIVIRGPMVSAQLVPPASPEPPVYGMPHYRGY